MYSKYPTLVRPAALYVLARYLNNSKPFDCGTKVNAGSWCVFIAVMATLRHNNLSDVSNSKIPETQQLAT
jgi:hypothetical protein